MRYGLKAMKMTMFEVNFTITDMVIHGPGLRVFTYTLNTKRFSP